jgi:hypothetical protein
MTNDPPKRLVIAYHQNRRGQVRAVCAAEGVTTGWEADRAKAEEAITRLLRKRLDVATDWLAPEVVHLATVAEPESEPAP